MEDHSVHLYGNPCDVGGLRRLADKYGLAIIEDCAEAIGTSVGERHVGATAHAATFGNFGNMTITTGEEEWSSSKIKALRNLLGSCEVTECHPVDATGMTTLAITFA